jgi:WD40 repeat protein
MAPEQAAGQTLDARADVYSAGVVLAEMVSPEGIKNLQSRQSVWEGVRSEPAKLPDSPWAPVLKKAVAKDREGRYNTARTLTRALEDVTLRVEGAEDLHPYPGLASFTEEDAEYFFGREAEVEQMWRKLEGPTRMLALVGPSGAGKTSFLRAGLFPAATPQWATAICKPSNNPQLALGRALAPEMPGDTEVMDLLLRFDDPEVAVEVLSRWRRRNDRALLVVDQFEELLTQNSDEEQRRFADLLNRLVLDADVCVLLSMRDDFMIRCRDFEAFKPTFSDLTAIPTLAGHDLRRALVQPATKCGYRFEDDELVEEMLAEVEGERGALPLLAFAAAQLWEKRDRDTGLLTRGASHDIGGVGGALAKHAESTIDRIGSDRISIVRELFRNLVTAEGTRAVREWSELLSVFDSDDTKISVGEGFIPSRESAEEVLRELIDARLLTSYEVREEDKEPTRRVEIIHESLLANWPRLVRWQTQDADAAQLRDQLRQAARTWNEQGRSDDTLWTGSAYREFAVWRESYPGGLTEVEEAFASAMTSLATRRRRRRRIAATFVVVFLALIATVFGALWRRSVQETRRAEAGKLLALGQAQLEPDPTGALAYTRASLELFDTPEARRFALEVLWSAPVARILPVQRMALEIGLPEDPAHIGRIKFSPDGRWLATRSASRRNLLFPSDGGSARLLPPHPDGNSVVMQFGPRGDLLIARGPGSIMRFFSLPGLEEIRSVEVGGFGGGGLLLRDGRLLTLTTIEEGGDVDLVRAWPLPNGEPEILGTFTWDVGAPAEIDPSGSIIAYKRGRTLLARPMPPGDQSAERILGEGLDVVADIAFSPAGDRLAALDRSGEIRVWPTAEGAEGPLHVFQGPEFLGMTRMIFGPNGRTLVQPGKGSDYFLWDLDAPRDSEPVMARRPELINVPDTAFDPAGRWLVTCGTTDTVTFWPLRRPWRRVIPKLGSSTWGMAFINEGRWLATCSIARPPKLWPLTSESGGARDLVPEEKCMFLAADPERDRILVNVQSGKVLLLSTSGVLRRSLAELGYAHVALDPAGDRAVASPAGFAPLPPQYHLLKEWDLRSGNERDHSLAKLGDPDWMGFGCMDFAPDGSLYASGPGSVYRLILPDEPGGAVSVETIFEAGSTGSYLSRDGRYLLVTGSEKTGWNHDFKELVIFDLEQHEQFRITTHGDRLGTGTFDPSGRVIITGDFDGVVRVGPVSGEEPHLLLGHTEMIESLAVSPDGRWIASADAESFRLWPMPDVSKPPLHTLHHDELLAKLDTFTNLRAVRDETSATGWSLEIGPFPGWETVPEW